MYTYKIMLLPNNKQKTSLKNTMNKCIEASNIIHDLLKKYIDNKKNIPNVFDVRKAFTKIKRKKDDEVLALRNGLTHKEMREKHLDVLFYDVSNDALKQAVKDKYKSFINCFRKLSRFPVKKNFNQFPKSFYVDPYKIGFTNNKVILEKLTTSLKRNRQVLNVIKLAEKGRIPIGVKYYNPRVSFDGIHFWLCVGVDDQNAPKKKLKPLTDKEVGIDLNIKEFVTSDNVRYKNILKTSKYLKNEKKLKRLLRSLSRKYEVNKTKKTKSNNFIKQKYLIRKQYKKNSNLLRSNIEFIIEDIYKTPPKKIVIEDLDVKSMQKNKLISNKLQLIGFHKFKLLLINKAEKYKTTIVEANRYYPSSKKCCKCGNIKRLLPLNIRTYKCEKCGLIINRDYNAAINLKNYC